MVAYGAVSSQKKKAKELVCFVETIREELLQKITTCKFSETFLKASFSKAVVEKKHLTISLQIGLCNLGKFRVTI